MECILEIWLECSYTMSSKCSIIINTPLKKKIQTKKQKLKPTDLSLNLQVFKRFSYFQTI